MNSTATSSRVAGAEEALKEHADADRKTDALHADRKSIEPGSVQTGDMGNVQGGRTGATLFSESRRPHS